MVLSVLSIMITAPVGAWLILNFGPKLLPQTKMDNVSMTEHQLDSRNKPEEWQSLIGNNKDSSTKFKKRYM